MQVRHKADRLKWSKEAMGWTKIWKTVVFSDEKKFNLHGPEGFQLYFDDFRKEEVYLSRRVQSSGSVMVWTAFEWDDTSDIVFIDGRMNARAYQGMLNEHLVGIGRQLEGRRWLFQHENATIHNAASTISWLQHKNVKKVPVMDLSSLPPDLNSIRNLWGMLVRMVYCNGRQLENTKELKDAIRTCWNCITVNTCQKN